MKRRCALSLTLLFSSVAANAFAAPSCMDAAAKAEREHGIPSSLLQAITMVETGRYMGETTTPWPWTTNLNAKGRYFASEAEAKSFVRKAVEDGETSIDIGCFQINTKWHGQHFGAIEEIFDPAASADYAAKFLIKLKAEFGDWNTAATKYHSRDPKKAAYYGTKLDAVRLAINEMRPAAPSPSLFSAAQTGAPKGGVAISVFLKSPPLIRQNAGQAFIKGMSTDEL